MMMNFSKQMEDLVKTFHEKGFVNLFTSQRESPGTLRELISDYLKSEELFETSGKPDLRLFTYLDWKGENNSYITCNISLSKQGESFSIDKMITEKKNCYGILLRKSELDHLPIDSLPNTRQLIESVESPAH